MEARPGFSVPRSCARGAAEFIEGKRGPPREPPTTRGGNTAEQVAWLRPCTCCSGDARAPVITATVPELVSGEETNSGWCEAVWLL